MEYWIVCKGNEDSSRLRSNEQRKWKYGESKKILSKKWKLASPQGRNEELRCSKYCDMKTKQDGDLQQINHIIKKEKNVSENRLKFNILRRSDVRRILRIMEIQKVYREFRLCCTAYLGYKTDRTPRAFTAMSMKMPSLLMRSLPIFVYSYDEAYFT